jgi:hypothetical protein
LPCWAAVRRIGAVHACEDVVGALVACAFGTDEASPLGLCSQALLAWQRRLKLWLRAFFVAGWRDRARCMVFCINFVAVVIRSVAPRRARAVAACATAPWPTAWAGICWGRCWSAATMGSRPAARGGISQRGLASVGFHCVAARRLSRALAGAAPWRQHGAAGRSEAAERVGGARGARRCGGCSRSRLTRRPRGGEAMAAWAR